MIKLTNPAQASSLFEGWEQPMIWSCLQGLMGEIWVDCEKQPRSAIAKIGRKSSFGFLAGQPNRDLIDLFREEDIILVPQHQDWIQLLDKMGEYTAFTRYAIKKNTVFDIQKLEQFAQSLPNDMCLYPIDKHFYQECLKQDWSSDLVANYATAKEYQKRGLGFVAVKNDQVIAGASSYATYQDGIEIEVDTQEDFRRQGLATALASKLILTCLEMHLYPSWDAHTKHSLALAEKLGYELAYEYVAYERM